MYKIIMSGEFGWDILSGDIRAQLNEAAGQDIEVDLNSPGGYLSDGIESYTLFSKYKEQYPQAQMILNVLEAQSFASYLMANSAFDIVTVRQNSMVMIHNPANGIIGDYRAMKKNADVMERTAIMMSVPYREKMNISDSEIREIMNVETVYIGGEEILSTGLANELVGSDKAEDKESLRASAMLRMQACKNKMLDKEKAKQDLEKSVAILSTYETNSNNHYQNSKQPAVVMSGKNNQEDVVIMNENELQEKHSDLHASVMKAGESEGLKLGIQQERNRVAELTKMKEDESYKKVPECMVVIDKAIVNGDSPDDCKTKMFAEMTAVLGDPAKRSKMLANSESPGDIDGGHSDGSEDLNLEKKENKW